MDTTDNEDIASPESSDGTTKIHNKSSPLEKLVMELLHGVEVSVEGGPNGPAGKVIKQLFKEAHKVCSLLLLLV